MRLLFVNYGPQSGVVRAVARVLRARHIDLSFYDPVEGFLWKRRLRSMQIPNVRPEVIGAALRALQSHGRYWKEHYLHTCYSFDRLTSRAESAVRALKPDVILQSGVLFAPGRCLDVPYYLYLDHTRAIAEAYEPVPGLPPPFAFVPAWRARETAVYRGAEAIFTMSDHVRASLERDYGVDRHRVHVVGAGPNVVPAAPTHGAPRERAVLFVGAHWLRKGGPDLLEAFALVQATRPDVTLWVAGCHLGYAPQGVRVFGRLDADELARLYSHASVFVLPSVREPFGLSFLEAMSFGLPCVGTAIEAIREIVVHGETGLLVPRRDPSALASAMGALLDDPSRAAAMGEAGRARVTTRFGWERAVNHMVDVIMEGRRHANAAPEYSRLHA